MALVTCYVDSSRKLLSEWLSLLVVLTYLVNLVGVEATNLEQDIRAESLGNGSSFAKRSQRPVDIFRVGKKWSVIY
jgi:hypothetical protein